MAYYKKFIIILLLLFIILFNFSSCFASEDPIDVDTVSTTTVNGITISRNSNYFTTSNDYNVYYFEVEKGYSYTIYNNKGSAYLNIASSSDIPAANGNYNFLINLGPNENYNFISNNADYLVLSFSGVNDNNVVITKQKIEGQENAIQGLVDNVGPNALWGVFGSGLDFVFVVVIVAFGIFIIIKLIKGLSKGKSKI